MALRYQHFITPTGTAEFPKVVRGEGVYIWDHTGRRLLDGSSGAVSVNIGHAHPRVLEAMREQMNKIIYAHSMRWDNDPSQALAERLARLSGWDFEAAFFVSGGSEANEAAIKFARQVAVARGQASRYKIISRVPSYHGATTALLGITGDTDYAKAYKPMFVDMPKIDAPLLYRRPAHESVDDVIDRCVRQLEDTIIAQGPETVLAFMIEPVGGVSTGALMSPVDYYDRCRQICDRYGVLMIYDEIMSGAGRTGRFLAAHHWPDCRPDIVTLAKGVSGSYAPLGAVLASSAMVNDVRLSGGFKHGHTYSANPLGCAASNMVLQVLEDEALMPRATLLGERIRTRLEDLKSRTRVIGDIRGIGLHMAVEIVVDKDTKEIFTDEVRASEKIGLLCREYGLLLFSRRTAGAAYGEWLMFCPPLTISDAEVEEMLAAFEKGVFAFQNSVCS
ncbi:aminotransferase class III-fold pyridoxal phosphate-dependent enzyme [Pseudomonas fluorescens]|uniref:aminotransferase family protein n=1 Tax=Pseudomonas fluorescens TaxID=294 RepID=UPI0035241210